MLNAFPQFIRRQWLLKPVVAVGIYFVFMWTENVYFCLFITVVIFLLSGFNSVHSWGTRWLEMAWAMVPVGAVFYADWLSRRVDLLNLDGLYILFCFVALFFGIMRLRRYKILMVVAVTLPTVSIWLMIFRIFEVEFNGGFVMIPWDWLLPLAIPLVLGATICVVYIGTYAQLSMIHKMDN